MQENNKNYGSSWNKEQKFDSAKNLGEKTEAPAEKISIISHRIFWGLVALAAIGVAASGFYLYNYFSASREISLIASAKENVLMGVPFELAVDFDNGSKKVLENAKLSVLLPEGTAALDIGKEKRNFEKEIGDIDLENGFSEKIKILVFSNGESVKKFNVSVSYTSALGTTFEKKQTVEVSVREPAIKLDLAVPEKVLNNEEFETIIKYSNISEFDFSGVRLNLNFPKNFIIKSSSPVISSLSMQAGNVLEIGDLKKNQKGEITVIGKISGASQTFFEINSNVESSYLPAGQGGGSQVFKISEKSAKVNIAPSPLFLKIESDAPADYVFPGSNLKFRVFYTNNSDVGLRDIVIKAKLNGEMFDFSQLRTNASFDSRDNTLAWNAASNPELHLIEPAGSGAVEFEISVKPSYPIRRLSDKNFVLKVAADISSPTVPYYVATDKTTGFANWEIKIAGAVALDSKIYFRDPSALTSGILNKGSLPPKADNPINFIVHWMVRNYSTDVKNAVVRAYLGSGVKLVGEAKSNISSVPIYNERTQEVSWFIDRIAATKGVVNKPIEAVFQIELLPNINQIGSYPVLMGDSLINAIDEFVNLQLTGTAKGVTTQGLSDIGFDSKNGEVISK